GGQGSRLAPLTLEQAKPAVAFGPEHRIIDFALSNLLNSGIDVAHVLVQHNARSIRSHLQLVWHSVSRNAFVKLVQPRAGPFQGTADAVRQSIEPLGIAPDCLVLVFGADHVYRMDVSQLIEFHLARDADVTVAALPVPRAEASAFGVLGCERGG